MASQSPQFGGDYNALFSFGLLGNRDIRSSEKKPGNSRNETKIFGFGGSSSHG
jgi:hypothetical protein